MKGDATTLLGLGATLPTFDELVEAVESAPGARCHLRDRPVRLPLPPPEPRKPLFLGVSRITMRPPGACPDWHVPHNPQDHEPPLNPEQP